MKLDERIAGRARKNHTALLNGLRTVGQNRVAELIGESDTTVSRFKDAEFQRLTAILAACGLKVVPEDMKFYDQEFMAALQLLARRGLAADSPEFEETL